MKIAAIDVGSNSIHMVIVEVAASGAFRVIDRETEMVRLGAQTFAAGALPEEAMQRAIVILKAFRRLTAIHGVDEILAVSTSAIREARNGEDFLDRVGRKVGITPRAIPGEEEARLIYLAALHSVHLRDKRALVVDIGGGSVELVLGKAATVRLAVSEKLGVLRMTERFLESDPPEPEEERRLARHVRRTLEPAVRRIRKSGCDIVVGTSGTILSIGRLAIEAATGRRPETLHHVPIPSQAVHDLRRQLTRLDLRGRLKLGGMDRRRADIIVAGSIVLDTILDMLGAETLTLCEWSLREGLLIDYIHRHPKLLARAEAVPDVRRRSVLELAERCAYDEAHSRHVTRLALFLFDATRRRHGLAADERLLLESAGTLHDIGHHISQSGHHKHSYYLIKNGGLRGFDQGEIEMIANIARYHRRGEPNRKHPAFAALPRALRTKVQVLSAILRLADGLDRSHRQRIRSIRISARGRALDVRCRATGDAELELWGANRRLDLLETVLGLPVRVSVVRPARTFAARRSTVRGRR